LIDSQAGSLFYAFQTDIRQKQSKPAGIDPAKRDFIFNSRTFSNPKRIFEMKLLFGELAQLVELAKLAVPICLRLKKRIRQQKWNPT